MFLRSCRQKNKIVAHDVCVFYADIHRPNRPHHSYRTSWPTSVVDCDDYLPHNQASSCQRQLVKHLICKGSKVELFLANYTRIRHSFARIRISTYGGACTVIWTKYYRPCMHTSICIYKDLCMTLPFLPPCQRKRESSG